MSGLVDSGIKGFQKYVSSLRTLGDYLHVGEDAAIAATLKFLKEKFMFLVQCLILRHIIYNVRLLINHIKIAFFEPVHYKALATSERINHGENLNISSQKRVKKQGGAKAQSTPEYKGDHSDRLVNDSGDNTPMAPLATPGRNSQSVHKGN